MPEKSKVDPYPSESEAIAAAKRCGNCKHWSGMSAALQAGWGMCFVSCSEVTTSKFFKCSTGLLTKPEFGCNQFKSE